MKKLILLISLSVVSLLTFSQTVRQGSRLKPTSLVQDIREADYRKANEFADFLAKYLDRPTIRENHSGRGGLYCVSFYNDEWNRSSTASSVIVEYAKIILDENRDLDIKGQQVFRFVKVVGAFLDLYPMWLYLQEENHQPIASKELITKDRQSIFYSTHNNKQQYIYVFSKRTDDVWWIELREQY